MPHVIERAPSARSKCRGCGEKIASGAWRFGESLPNPFAEGEGFMTHWFHVPCAAFRRPEPFLEALATATEDMPDRDQHRHEAQLGVTHRRLPRASTAERASTARAACRECKEKIDKDTWRISLLYYEDGRFAPSGFVHIGCAAKYFETSEIMARVKHFSPALTDRDLEEIARGLEHHA